MSKAIEEIQREHESLFLLEKEPNENEISLANILLYLEQRETKNRRTTIAKKEASSSRVPCDTSTGSQANQLEEEAAQLSLDNMEAKIIQKIRVVYDAYEKKRNQARRSNLIIKNQK